MPIWKLTPIDLSDPNWEASSHRAVVIVRARDETAARDLAAEAFDVATRFSPKKGLRVPPWRRQVLVRAEQVKDDRFEANGPAVVLDPSP